MEKQYKAEIWQKKEDTKEQIYHLVHYMVSMGDELVQIDEEYTTIEALQSEKVKEQERSQAVIDDFDARILAIQGSK